MWATHKTQIQMYWNISVYSIIDSWHQIVFNGWMNWSLIGKCWDIGVVCVIDQNKVSSHLSTHCPKCAQDSSFQYSGGQMMRLPEIFFEKFQLFWLNCQLQLLQIITVHSKWQLVRAAVLVSSIHLSNIMTKTSAWQPASLEFLEHQQHSCFLLSLEVILNNNFLTINIRNVYKSAEHTEEASWWHKRHVCWI